MTQTPNNKLTETLLVCNRFGLREGLKKNSKSWLLTKRGGGGWRKNQLTNFIC